jgi:hypothetical protein
VAIGLAVFLVLRWLQNYVWGLVAGLLLPLHPLLRAGDLTFQALPLLLVVLACTTAGWRLSFGPSFARKGWLVVAAGLVLASALAWPLAARTGLMAAVVAGVGLLGAAVLAARLRKRKGTILPSWGNVTAAAVLGILTPAAGLVLAQVLLPESYELKAPSEPLVLLEAGVGTKFPEFRIEKFTSDELQRWAWPQPWVVGILMIWGFWRSCRRGWKQWRRRQPPMAWTLTLFAVVSFAGATLRSYELGGNTLLPLAALAVLLSIFGVADMVRGFMERLVLAPPQEREE